jgi:hypothetical protein
MRRRSVVRCWYCTAALVASFAVPPQELSIEGEGHNTIQDDPEYSRALGTFLQ